jgi:hypothetical protein
MFWHLVNRRRDPLELLHRFIGRYATTDHLRQELALLERELRKGRLQLFDKERVVIADLIADIIAPRKKAPKRLPKHVESEVMMTCVAKWALAAESAGQTREQIEAFAKQHYGVTLAFVDQAVGKYILRDLPITEQIPEGWRFGTDPFKEASK